MWNAVEIRQVSDLISPIPQRPDVLFAVFPLRLSPRGSLCCARAMEVESFENELLIHIKTYPVNKGKNQFLTLGPSLSHKGTAVMFLPRGGDPLKSAFPYVKGHRGEVTLQGKEYLSYFLHSGSLMAWY